MTNEEFIRYFQRTRGDGSTAAMPVAIHPNPDAQIIVVNYPGFNGIMGGYEDKYVKLAQFMMARLNVAVVRLSNIHWGELEDYPFSVQADLQNAIEQILAQAARICGTPTPQIYLMGTSAGASAIAAVCSQFPQVTKILLTAPSSDAGPTDIADGLGGFTGEVSIVTGADDRVVGPGSVARFAAMAGRASVVRKQVLPNCDHQFTGRENGMILSKAPLWAFGGDTTFPDPSGGIVLYY